MPAIPLFLSNHCKRLEPTIIQIPWTIYRFEFFGKTAPSRGNRVIHDLAWDVYKEIFNKISDITWTELSYILGIMTNSNTSMKIAVKPVFFWGWLIYGQFSKDCENGSKILG